jgi:hypothetical protein
MGLTNMLDPKYLSLMVNQAEGNTGLANMSDPKELGRGSKLSSKKYKSGEHVKLKILGHYQVLRLYV